MRNSEENNPKTAVTGTFLILNGARNPFVNGFFSFNLSEINAVLIKIKVANTAKFVISATVPILPIKLNAIAAIAVNKTAICGVFLQEDTLDKFFSLG